MPQEEKFLCINPDPSKAGTRISKNKYNIVKQAILEAVEDYEDGIYFKELSHRVQEILDKDELDQLGSVGWYTTTVKLDLEARGFIQRVPGSKPQRLQIVEK